ncbi:MAG: DUF4157 domain-containing protein [Candidatus Promineifilaceae bacterium]|nr:DUF4157 domain-containing protein [Candidatus Promineifilaceae bacterium]
MNSRNGRFFVLFSSIFLWLGERLRDLLMWPINLVRDFPIRIARLLSTFLRAADAILFFLPEFLDAIRHKEIGSWLRFKAGRFFDWLHQFITNVLDLFGLPEILEFLMHLLTKTTPLNGDELATISTILGPNAMRFGDIRVVEGGVFDLVFKLNGNLAFATWHSINLPRTGRHTRENRSIVVHELTHVFQYEQIGSRYLGEAIYMLVKTKRDCYNYGGPAGLAEACLYGKKYCHFNREQQAMITQDYYIRRERGLDTLPYEPFIHQVQSGEV